MSRAEETRGKSWMGVRTEAAVSPGHGSELPMQGEGA